MKLSPQEVLDAAGKTAMLSALGAPAVAEFVRQCRVLNLPQGRSVFLAGQVAQGFYVVLAGRVRIYKLSPRGDEQILHLYGPGETFGEAAMWAGQTYPAHCETDGDSALLEVRKDALRRAIHQSPELAMGMLAGLSAKLREFNHLIEELSLKEVPARLAGVLLKLSAQARSRTIKLKQTKRQLASQIGTVAETLSRALAKMKVAGLIGVRGSEIVLLDAAGLEALAGGESVL